MKNLLWAFLCVGGTVQAQTYYDKTSIDPRILYSQANWQGSGTNALLVPSTVTGIGMNFARNLTGAVNVADFYFHRNANYTGGDNTKVNAALYAKTVTTSGANSYEWNAIFVMDNNNTLADASQNLALGTQAFKRSSGNTWVRYAELNDDIQDSTGTAVTDEVDLYANGTQANNNRFIMHLVAGPKNYGGTAHIEHGIKFSPQNNGGGGTASAIVDNAWIGLSGDYLYGIRLTGGSSTSGAAALYDNRTGSNLTYGLILTANYGSGAVYIASDKNFLWSSDQSVKSRYVTADSCLEFIKTSTTIFSVCDDGHVAASGGFTATGAITPSTTAGIVGTTSADSANAGSVGEVASINCLVGASAASATTVLMPVASPGVVTWTSHTFVPSTGLANYTCPINFLAGSGALPTGISAGTTYYIIGSTVSGDTFQVSDTAAHALAGTNAINFTVSSTPGMTAFIGAVGATNVVVAGAALKLTAGDWDCSHVATYQELTAITSTRFASWVDTSLVVTTIGNGTNIQTASSSLGGVSYYINSPVVRENVSATTSVFGIDDSTFTVGTMNQGGKLYCRRMR